MSNPAKRRGSWHISEGGASCLRDESCSSWRLCSWLQAVFNSWLSIQPYRRAELSSHRVSYLGSSMILSSCQGLEQYRVSAILWGQSRAQELVQNESQAKGFGYSHFKFVEVLPLMAVAPGLDLCILPWTNSWNVIFNFTFLMWCYVILRIYISSHELNSGVSSCTCFSWVCAGQIWWYFSELPGTRVLSCHVLVVGLGSWKLASGCFFQFLGHSLLSWTSRTWASRA